MGESPENHQKSKDVDIQWHFTREQVGYILTVLRSDIIHNILPRHYFRLFTIVKRDLVIKRNWLYYNFKWLYRSYSDLFQPYIALLRYTSDSLEPSVARYRRRSL